jgi:hypothetical protein
LTCTPDEHEALKAKKSEACDNLPNSCAELVRTSGGGGAVCIGLSGRRGEFQKCKDVRQEVTDRCFGGVNDATHQQQIDAMQALLDKCDELLAQICPGT